MAAYLTLFSTKQELLSIIRGIVLSFRVLFVRRWLNYDSLRQTKSCPCRTVYICCITMDTSKFELKLKRKDGVENRQNPHTQLLFSEQCYKQHIFCHCSKKYTRLITRRPCLSIMLHTYQWSKISFRQGLWNFPLHCHWFGTFLDIFQLGLMQSLCSCLMFYQNVTSITGFSTHAIKLILKFIEILSL